MLICLSASGCGDSSKDQAIVVYDYSNDAEKEYSAANEAMDGLVNSICDFFLDGESGTGRNFIVRQFLPFQGRWKQAGYETVFGIIVEGRLLLWN